MASPQTKRPSLKWLVAPFTVCKARVVVSGRRQGEGQLRHFALHGPHSAEDPKRSIYSNRTVKYSIKAVIMAHHGEGSTFISCPGPLQ